jgi:predicted transcriptional regulator
MYIILSTLLEKTLSIRISQEMRKELESLSKVEKRPLSDLVRESLREFLVVRKFRRLRKRTLPFAEAQGFLTDEDIFKAL